MITQIVMTESRMLCNYVYNYFLDIKLLGSN